MAGETPPGTPGPEAFASAAALSWADVGMLVKRADFLSAARARRQALPSFILQARRRGDGEQSTHPVRIGYTCSKKVGNAVARNRAKRRLREAARRALPGGARAGWDYVLIGRKDATATRPFDLLVEDVAQALTRIHASRPQR